ncbi:MotA/TolQ/ExbB proton channel family protein [Roseibacillus ishigakijimensis]|uniref:MotA/TolQ/ExbB proton channel family protein n=1 Tax=Roseibacillus ishigakijimensis TaxID=454146 RepID=A0A934VMD2_9BACT|nr:MotA/TolQ/ExbB proton channel family protein [Roseibacillus ishigakijimensis]MBK1833971.1 MotA/TolQ/ExbB proton channel family protein [Roseibacillus ishigakijimensis]
MTKFSFSLFVFTVSAGAALGQVSSGDALVKARQNLESAQQGYLRIEQAIAAEESPLVIEAQTLEAEHRQKEKELRELTAQELQIAGKEKRLDDELASRRGEFDYTRNVLDGYTKGFLNRVHPAEVQLYQDAIEAARQEASHEKDLAAEMVARLEALQVGAQRLQEAAGGRRFVGRGLVGSDFVNGDFAVVGPVGYFAAKGKDLAGLTGLGSNGFPQISLFEGEEAVQMRTLVESGSGDLPIDATNGKALKAKNETPSLGDRAKDGGVVGYAILALGGVALLIALFKLIEIINFTIPSRAKVNEIVDALLAREVESAKAQAEAIRGLSGKMVEAGVENFYGKRRILEDALLEKLSAVQPRLERFLPFLALVAAAAPMMGLLGTVLGIMQTFDAMAIHGTGNAQNFSKGIGAALVTTAEGLVVAIPIIIIHGMLKSYARSRFDTAQGVALAILNGTTELEEKEPRDPENGPGGEEDFEEKEMAA